jgi:hypothetical protein
MDGMNRKHGLDRFAETVETVGGAVSGRGTLLKQGVNERGICFEASEMTMCLKP